MAGRKAESQEEEEEVLLTSSGRALSFMEDDDDAKSLGALSDLLLLMDGPVGAAAKSTSCIPSVAGRFPPLATLIPAVSFHPAAFLKDNQKPTVVLGKRKEGPLWPPKRLYQESQDLKG